MRRQIPFYPIYVLSTLILTSLSATDAAILPLSTPIKDINGCELTQIPIPKGTNIFVSITGSNYDPRVWGPDSYEWKPERWLEPLPEEVMKAKIPGVYSNL